MTARSRSFWFTAGFGLFCLLFMAYTTPLGTDFPILTERILEKLGSGDFPGYFQRQPEMGQFSVLLRWPAALAFPGQLDTYRAGCALCLLGPLFLAIHLARDKSAQTASMICVALILNPVTVRALKLGHPEELLCAAMVAGSMLAVYEKRFTWAGVLLGLALATKQWALLAALPVMLAAGRDQLWRTGGWAVAVAAVFTVPALLIDAHAFIFAMDHPAGGVIELRPGNLWSLIYGPQSVVSVGGNETVSFTNVPSWLRHTAHPGIIVLCTAVVLVGRRFVRKPTDWFIVLALVFLARCFFDPWNHAYYHAPFLAVLCCWEVVAGRRMPTVTVASTAALWFVFKLLASSSGASSRADVLYILWVAAISAWLINRLLQPVPEELPEPERTALRQTRAQDPVAQDVPRLHTG